MSIDRKVWLQTFDGINFPPWPCPTCGRGLLGLTENSYSEGQTVDHTQSGQFGDSGIKSSHGVFTAQLHCMNQVCNENVVTCGTYSYSSSSAKMIPINKTFELQFLLPSPYIFPIPNTCPESIASEVRRAFSLFWFDANSSGNRIRVSIELLLDHLKVKKRTIKNHKYHLLSLHDRIIEFHPTNPDLGEKLLAIKWIGNYSSHTQKINKENLLDDFELIQYVLEEIFGQSRKKLSAMARTINKRKGLPKT